MEIDIKHLQGHDMTERKKTDYPMIDHDQIIFGEMGRAGHKRCFPRGEFDIGKMDDGLYVLRISGENIIYWQGGSVSKLEKEFI